MCFVRAEKDQVTTFIRENKGLGVQHIALHTSDIVYTASSLITHGLRVVQPPLSYYIQVLEATSMFSLRFKG